MWGEQAASESSPPWILHHRDALPLSAPLQGKCDSKAVYNIDTEDVQDQCSCCSPTRTEPMQVPLHCANGSIVYHEVLNAMQCRCSPRKCSK